MNTILLTSVLCLCFFQLKSQSFLPVKQSLLPTDLKEKEFLSQLFKRGLHVNSFSVSSSTFYNKSFVSTDFFTTNILFQQQHQSQIGVDMFGIPFKAEYHRIESSPQFFDNTPKNWYKVSFDVEAYKAKWKLLAERLRPEAVTKSGAQLDAIKNVFKEKLAALYINKVKNKSASLFDSLSKNIDPLQLDSKTPEELERLFFGKQLQVQLDNALKKKQEIEAASLTAIQKDSLLSDLEEQIEEIEEKSQYVKQVLAAVEVAKNTGILETLKELGSKHKEEYDALLKDPTLLSGRLTEKYGLSGIVRLFTLLSQFKAGGQTLPFSSTSSIPFLGKGISFEVDLGNRFFGFSMGSILPINTNLVLQDTSNRLLQADQENKPSYWFLHYRKGRITTDHKGIKLTSITYSGINDRALQSNFLRKKNLLLLQLYSKERFFGDHWLSLEAGKSLVIGDRPKQSLLNLNNTSFKIALDGKIEPLGIVHNAYVQKLLGAFNNFSDNSLTSTGYEAGFSFRMKPKTSKVTTYLRGRFQNFHTPGTTNGKWNSADLRARISYRLKRGQSFQLSTNWHDGYKLYNLSSSVKVVRQQSRAITAEINLVNKRLFGLYNTSSISAGFQRDLFPVVDTGGKTGQSAVAYNFLLNQSFLMGDHLLQLNVFYTKVSQSLANFFYDTRLDIDGGGLFKLNDKFSLGSSLVFGYFKGNYTNVGVKTSVSAFLSQKLSVDVNADIRKNIRLQNPVFSQFLNFSCDLKYTFK